MSDSSNILEEANSLSQSTASTSSTSREQMIREEIERGLRADKVSFSPKFLYDPLGSVLFEAICELSEYYPTRTEAEIFSSHLSDIARTIGSGATLIDLGAGNCAKAATLFPRLHPEQYVPIDISIDHLREAVRRLQERFPHIEMTALGMDFTAQWQLPDEVRREKRLFFYPGSSIGNFDPRQALTFLKQIRAACDEDGGILIGVDLIKDVSLLENAYDDALGVTSAFNLNLLRHINRLIEADFEVRDWQHRAFFNADVGRVEMHLHAKKDVLVRWPNGERQFVKGEGIHTENSYKYTVPQFLQLLQQAGFGRAHHWSDKKAHFAVIHAEAI
jgi:dimethylhistidine N-methyltransferase